MKLFHHVTIQVFFREEDTAFINTLLPIPLEEFLEKQFIYDEHLEHTKVYTLKHAKLLITQSSETNLKVHKFIFAKQTDAKKVFMSIIENISSEQRKQLEQEILEYVDEDGNLYLRLDKLALEQGKFSLTQGGNCVHCTFSLAAYPKNEKTIQETALKLFS